MGLTLVGDLIIGYTGKSIILVSVNELARFFDSKYIIAPYLGLVDRIKGLGFMARRLFR